ncbi:hypothetical protein WJ45_15900 [Burkholderia ubonensis]|nr:hypothetical protein WJ45_15900 [Burkholderia ubonensis]KVQ54159.1 hypothetical protein WK04_02645 [Burkholderia ubonensis]
MMHRANLRSWPRRLLLGCAAGFAAANLAWAGDATAPSSADSSASAPTLAHFNPAFLNIGNSQGDAQSGAPDDAPHFNASDLAEFSHGNIALPGVHDVEVLLNDAQVGKHRVLFNTLPDNQGTAPCVTAKLLGGIGVMLSEFPAVDPNVAGQCIDADRQMPNAHFSYEADTEQLSITIPNAMLRHTARGAIDPSEFQNGIDGALFDYRISGSKSEMAGGGGAGGIQWYGSLRSGINLGPWRLRGTTTVNRDAGGTQVQFQDIYARRAFTGISSQFTIGDATTDGSILDSVPFRGVQLASDPAMEPESLQGYAPVIRGIAQTHAKVELRQNGFLIYSTYVPPGPFRIDDLYAAASNTDIEVTIIEADGRKRTFAQPYSTVSALLRDHAWRYRVTAGMLRVPGVTKASPFAQATLAHGLPGDFTLYGGVTVSPIYQAVVFGAARNMPVIGALSLDIKHARSRLPGGRIESGQSVRLAYNKSLDVIGTQFNVAGYRYSTCGYHSFSDVAAANNSTLDVLSTINARDRLEINIAQPLRSAGSLYATYTQQGYWGMQDEDRVLQFGYSGSYHSISYGLDLSYDRHPDGTSSKQVAFNLSIPFGKTQNHTFTASMLSGDGDIKEGASMSGTLLRGHQLNYSIRADLSSEGGQSGSASLNYLSGVGQFGVMQSLSKGSAQTSVEVAGGAVVHAHGITFSQPLGETIGLVAAPGASDVGIESTQGVSTDHAGYAVIPNLTPYRRNNITLRTADLGSQVAVRTATRIVTPRRGAIVLARYKVSKGRMMLDIKDQKGQPMPFGARIETLAGDDVGMVGPDGQGFVTGAGDRGKLRVRWGKQAAEQCELAFDLGHPSQNNLMPEATAVCRPLPARTAKATAAVGPILPSTGEPS